MILWHWWSSEEISAETNRLILEAIALDEGRTQAEKDFAANAPLWYQFPGDSVGDPPSAKSGRKLTMYDTEFLLKRDFPRARAFVKGYNKTMDDLFAKKARGPERKG